MERMVTFVLIVLAFNVGFVVGGWWATLPFDDPDDDLWKDR